MPDSAFEAWLDAQYNRPTFAEAIARFGTAAPPAPGMWSVLKKVGTAQAEDPLWGFKQGAKFGWETLKGFLTHGANAVQAVNPLPIGQAGATDPPRGIPGLYGPDEFTPEGISNNLSYRVQRLGNAVFFGLPDALQQNWDEVNKTSPPENVNDTILNLGEATWDTFKNDILPGREITDLLRGDKVVGKDAKGMPIREPLTAEEAAERVMGGALKTTPWTQHPWLRSGNPVSRAFFGDEKLPTQKVLTAGELEAARRPRKTGAIEGEVQEGGAVAAPALTPEMQTALKLDQLSLSKDQLHQVLGEAVQTEVFKKIATDNPDVRVNVWIAETARQGGFTPEFVGRFVKDQGLTPEQATNLFAKALQDTPHYLGQGLQAYSTLAERTMAEMALQASKGDMTAKAALRRLMKPKNDLTPYGKFVNFFNNIVEGARRAWMVAQPATALRNFRSQIGGTVVQMAEHMTSGAVEAATGIPRGRSFWDAWGDLASDFTALVDRMRPEGRAALRETLDNLPLVKLHIEGASAFDLNNHVFASALKGLRPEGAAEWVQAFSNTLNTLNRKQEFMFRHYFFQARLEGNLKALGWKPQNGKGIIHQLNEMIRNPEVDLSPDIRTAIADAANHSLKQTFAANFEGGFAGQVMNAYKNFPASTALFPPYPRFLLNQWRWQMERSPVVWFDIFDQGFRDRLVRGIEGGLKTREAARDLGKATTGIFLLNGAWVLQNSEVAGPKYYQLKNGEQLVDLRDTQPFVTYLGVAHIVKSLINNTPINMSGDEWTDFVSGLRRLSDYPAFGLTEMIRNMRSENPEVRQRTLTKNFGAWLGSFFTPLRALNDVYGGIESAVTDKSSERLVYRDSSGQDLIGPTQAIIDPSSMPARPNPFSDKPQQSEHPFYRQMGGISVSTQPKFQQLVLSTPGLEMGDLVGSWGSPEANRLVSAEIGKLLGTPTDKGLSLGDELAEALSKLNLTPEGRAHAIKIVFEDLRKRAIGSLGEHISPKEALSFGEHYLKQKPAIERPLYRDLLNERRKELGKVP